MNEGTGTAEETAQTISNIKKVYGIQEIVLPFKYAEAGALYAFLGLVESLTPAALIKKVSEAYASIGPDGRWRIAADYLNTMWARLEARNAIAWSA